MKSNVVGKNTLAVEVTQIDMKGIWLLIDDTESFLPFEKFPRFRKAAVGAIHNVERSINNHLYWPDLDIDLAIESIEPPKESAVRD